MTEFVLWSRRTRFCALLLLVATIYVAVVPGTLTALYLVKTQDVPILTLVAFTSLLVTWWRPCWVLPEVPSGSVLFLIGIVVVGLVALGAEQLLGNFPLSRDEYMVNFDMAVFDSGRAAMPLARQWQPYALTLVPEFLLDPKSPIGLISFYLPMNALLRLGFSKIADPIWFNPILLLIGGAALFDIAKRTFGPKDRACLVVLLMYVLSVQLLLNAATEYSMTAHVAFNLVWLAAFLRGGKFGNSIAIIAGFIATGLHQLVFHPFFVAPFLFWKFREGEHKLVLIYLVTYVVIILWWAYYPVLLAPLVQAPVHQASEANYVAERTLHFLLHRDPRTISLMLLNLMRFLAWQNLAFCPLIIASVPVVVRERGLARALCVGLILWLLFLAFVTPAQGRGWGYRYFNGYLGSIALLAGFGYRELAARIGARADGTVILLSSLTAIVSLPWVCVASYRFMEPHLAMQRLIQSQTTPFVLIDDTQSPSIDGAWRDTARDHVRNLPDLSNRPLRFSADNLSPNLLSGICGQGHVTVITRADMHAVGFLLNVAERSPRFDTLIAETKRETPDCFRTAVARRGHLL